MKFGYPIEVTELLNVAQLNFEHFAMKKKKKNLSFNKQTHV